MRRVLLVRTVMELAACGMFNLHHSFNIDAAELRDAPSLTWPEPTTATATPLGASIVDTSSIHTLTMSGPYAVKDTHKTLIFLTFIEHTTVHMKGGEVTKRISVIRVFFEMLQNFY